jgi:hypothetical protein
MITFVDINSKISEKDIINKIQLKIKEGFSINDIKFKMNSGRVFHYGNLFETEFNEYYSLFDFMMKNNYILDYIYSLIYFMNIEHIKIIKKYNCDVCSLIDFLISENELNKIKLILDIYDFNNLKPILLKNRLKNSNNKYLISLYLSKGYKLTDYDIKIFDKHFLKYLAEYSAEEWMNSRSCIICYGEIPANNSSKKCKNCEKDYGENEELDLILQKLREKNMAERF